MMSSIEFITTPTADTPRTTLVLRTQKHNYVFGSQAEGTQRAMVQQGTRLLRAQDFFLTGKMEWANTGGIIGLMLTLADSASTSYEMAIAMWREAQRKGKQSIEPPRPKLNFYGPSNLQHMIATCRRFLFRKGIPMVATEFPDATPNRDDNGVIVPSWQDEAIKVWALNVSPLRQEQDDVAEAALAEQQEFYDKYLNNFEEYQAPELERPQDREARYTRIRAATLNHMFNSNWSFDTLIERHISEVEMPAAMFVRNSNTHRFDPYTGPKPGDKEPLPDITVYTRTPWPGAEIVAIPPTKPTRQCISYIVRTHTARGQFDVTRAKALGVKPGPNFGKLTSGESVQNDKGETITPEMVLGPERPGQGVAILDIPSLDYLEAILEREELQSPEIMEGIGAIIWMLGPGLSVHPLLNEFMRTKGEVHHVVSSVDQCPNRIALDSVAAQTTRLGQIDPKRYKVPIFDNSTLPQNSLHGFGIPKQDLPVNAVVADRGLSFTLKPRFSMKKETISSQFDPTVVEPMTDAEVIALAKAARQTVIDNKETFLKWKRLVARPDTEVVTLGTGSALPSKYRNVSATLVRVPGIGNYLFDCGENTLGQLQRVFATEELLDVIKNLRMIWISHLHADHHLGTASVIRAWYHIMHGGVPAPSPPDVDSLASNASLYGLSVVSHNGMLKWLKEYSSIEDFGYSRILPLEIFPAKPRQESGSHLSILNEFSPIPTPTAKEVKKEDYQAIMGISDIQAVRVAHCHGAMAVSLTFPPSLSDPESVKPLKVSYSGDCRPSMDFARIGHDTTVLIHEATFDDELQGDARAKKHSTTSEALGIGAQMDAKTVVLTHFSQRYQKIPVLETVQDDEQADPPLDSKVIQNAAGETRDDDNEGDPKTESPDNMDIHPTPAAHPPGHSAPPTLKHQGSATIHNYERVVKVRSKDMKVAVAFDYMRVNIGEIIELEKFNDALNKLLVEEEEEDAAIGNGDGSINSNGKKTSGDEGGGDKKKIKKSKRNN